MRRSLECLALLAILPCCDTTMECGNQDCPQLSIVPGEYTAEPGLEPKVGPHANATNRTATISPDKKTLTIRYQRDGKEVVETWAIGQ